MTQQEIRESIESSMEDILLKIEEVSGIGTSERVKEGDTEFETDGVLSNLIDEYNFKKAILDDMDKKSGRKLNRINTRDHMFYGG